MNQKISGPEIFLKVHSVEQIRDDLSTIDIEVLVIDEEKVLPFHEVELTLGDRSQGVITSSNGRMRNHLVFPVNLMQRQTLRAKLIGTQGGEATYQILSDNYEAVLAELYMSAPITSPQVHAIPPEPQIQPIPVTPPTPAPPVQTSPTAPPVIKPEAPPLPPMATLPETDLDTSAGGDLLTFPLVTAPKEPASPPVKVPSQTEIQIPDSVDISGEPVKTGPIVKIELENIGKSSDRLNFYRRIKWVVKEGQSVEAGDLIGNICDDPDGVSVIAHIRVKEAGRIHKLMNFDELTDEILYEVVAEYIPA